MTLRSGSDNRRSDAVERRSRRVILLLWGIVLLSLADLIMTLGHLKSIGMVEANPIAAWLIRNTQSPLALSAFKGLSVTVCVSLLYWARHRLAGEAAAWCAVAILTGLALFWHHYSAEIESPGEVKMVQVEHSGEWLYLD